MNFARSRVAPTLIRGAFVALAAALRALLVACGAPGSPASEQATFAAGPPKAPTATNTPSGTPTPDIDPFQVVISDSYTEISCPQGEDPGSYCADVAGSGTALGSYSSYGKLNLARTANLASPYALNGCVPTSTYGTLTMGARGSVTFKGEGTHCGSDGSATYTYDITGGTGTLTGSTGHGVIVATAITNNSGSERWSGTLILPK